MILITKQLIPEVKQATISFHSNGDNMGSKYFGSI